MTASRLALVTGSSSGLGLAIATGLVGEGWDVIGLARRDPAIRDPRYRHVTVDLADLERARATIEREVVPRIRADGVERLALVNNAAAIGRLGPTETMDPLMTLRSYAVNTVAPMWLMGLVVRHAPRAIPIRIVNVSSGAAVAPFPGLGVYCGTKAALRIAGQVFAVEVESPLHPGGPLENVAILSYQPGVVDTAMQTEARETTPENFPWVGTFVGFQRDGRLVTPEASAARILSFVASDPAARHQEERFGG